MLAPNRLTCSTALLLSLDCLPCIHPACIRRCSFGGAGAVWHMCSRAAVPALNDWLAANRQRFVHQGRRLDDGSSAGDGGSPLASQGGGGSLHPEAAVAPIISSCFMIGPASRAALCAEAGACVCV
jgi:hypothetical protein